ncbi:MAG: hypothetical protein SNG49_00570 [Rikenellaceae bacterium]
MKSAVIETLVERATTSWDDETLQSYPSGKPTFTNQKLTQQGKTERIRVTC